MERNNNTGYHHLVELIGSNYEIADGEPDIIGWNVQTGQGQKVGDVDDLLFDPQSRKVRYIIVDLDDNGFGINEDKKIMVPIGIAQLRRTGDVKGKGSAASAGANIGAYTGMPGSMDTNVETGFNDNTISDGFPVANETGPAAGPNADGDGQDIDIVTLPVTADQLQQLPSYKKGDINPGTETFIRDIFNGSGALAASAYNREDFYDHDHFDESKFYGTPFQGNQDKLPVIEERLNIDKREVSIGGARITARIVERPVKETVNLRQEHVTVNRIPVDEPVKSSDPRLIKEEEIQLTEYAEVPVVSKEARVVEEVLITKTVEEKQKTIKETLRNTEVETQRINSANSDLL